MTVTLAVLTGLLAGAVPSFMCWKALTAVLDARASDQAAMIRAVDRLVERYQSSADASIGTTSRAVSDAVSSAVTAALGPALTPVAYAPADDIEDRIQRVAREVVEAVGPEAVDDSDPTDNDTWLGARERTEVVMGGDAGHFFTPRSAMGSVQGTN